LANNQETVDVNLTANATTGYQWFVQSYDHNLLSLQNYRYTPTVQSGSKKLVGAGGTATFTFNIDPSFYDGPQVTTLQFVYEQPWNVGQNAATATVTVSSVASNNDKMDWQKYPSVDDSDHTNDVPMPSTPTPSSENSSSSNWISLPAAAGETATNSKS
jgi:predicted secreted protein